MRLEERRVGDLHIEDQDVLRGIGLYRDLERILVEDAVPFWVPARGAEPPTWAQVLFLNLTFWGEGQADVLESARVPGDVVAHVAWHHLARRALGAASADAVFLGEAVASAFDLYLVGRLLPLAPECGFIETQVPALSDVALAAGASEADVERMLAEIVAAPERAFEDLRQLLFDAATRLVARQPVPGAAAVLTDLAGHRFAPLLHHYELSNWLLHARANLPAALEPDPAVRGFDARLRTAPDALALLERAWVFGQPDEQ